MAQNNNRLLWVVSLPVGIYFTLGLLAPLGVLLWTSLTSPISFDWWHDPYLRHVLQFTLWQALISALFSAVVGTAAAVIYSEQRYPSRFFWWNTALVSFSLPGILVVLGFVSVWGRAGIVARLFPGYSAQFFYGWGGIIAAHVFFNYALYFKLIGTALVTRSRTREKAALSLGASRLRCFFTLTLPQCWGEYRSAFFLSFLFSAMSFIVVLMLGGGPRFTTLEVAIYQAIKTDGDLPLATRLALIQLTAAVVCYCVFLKPSRRVTEGEWVPLYLFRSRLNNSVARAGVGGLLVLLVGAPLAGLLLSALPGLRVLPWETAGKVVWASLRMAWTVATLAVFFAGCLGYLSRHAPAPMRQASDAWGMLPQALSPLLLCAALLGLYPRDWLQAAGGFWPVVLIQVLIALPVVFRPVRDGLWAVPEEWLRVASSLGADSWATLWRVEIPSVKNNLVTAWLLAFSFSLGEVGASILFLSEEAMTLPLWIYRLMGQYRFDEAYAVGGILLLAVVSVHGFVGRRFA